ncbi:MAG TPA: DUF998 domain-containing protein [Anaerolineae bacterium]|nr:DUF998 domain-containing protein [Anaerolineae bacterium]
MTDRFVRLAGLAGLLTPVLTLTLIFVSIALSPWFSWHDNALSDMGVNAIAPLFNGAMLLGGLLYFVFTIGFLRWQGLRSRLAKSAAVAMIIGAIGLLSIGIFTEAAGRIHYYVSATYFLATPLAYELLGFAWVQHDNKLMGWLTIAAGITAFLMIAAVPHKRIAVPEILAALTMGTWTFTLGMKMIIEPGVRS